MKHTNYFRFLESSTPDDIRAYVMDALHNIPEEWQGYDVTFSQYGLAKMLVDLGHGRLSQDGTIVVKTIAGHTVHFTPACPFIGLSTVSEHSAVHYAIIVPEGIAIDNAVYSVR